MKKFLIITASIFVVACNEEKLNAIDYQVTYKMIIGDNTVYNKLLEEKIISLINSGQNSQDIQAYHTLTKDYLSYFTVLESEIEKSSSAILFENDVYSAQGKELISKTNSYFDSVRALVKDENLKQRLNFVLNTNNLAQADANVPGKISVNNYKNDRKLNTVYFNYLDYYYKGLPNSQVLALLSTKKRSILELENEYILSKISIDTKP